MNTRIIYNGKEYQGIDEMPPDVKEAYQRAMSMVLTDKDQNGIPDILEGKGPGPDVKVTAKYVSKIVINGKAYDTMDDLPEHYRRIMEVGPGKPARAAKFSLRANLFWLILALLAASLLFRLLSRI